MADETDTETEAETEVKDGPGLEDAVVEIELDGRTHKLVPSMNACLGISDIDGGGAMAAMRCERLDLRTICKVIELGVGFNPRQAQMIPEAVYKAGVMKCAGPCIEFINIVNNGGKRLKDDEPEDDDPLAEG